MNRKPLFERGDIILDLKKKEPRLILSIKEDKAGFRYEFMELEDQNWKDIYGNYIGIKKGEISFQPCDIVEKHFSIYNMKNYE
jgi:hypothetical protein